MGAPAVAPRRAPAPSRRTPSRRSPSRRSPSRRTPARGSKGRAAANRTAAQGSRPKLVRRRANPRPNPALAGAALLPQAAVSAAGAVRDLSDSSLIMRLTRGRGWIAVLCALLGGIVALNVVSLSLNAGSGRLEQRIGEVERSNSALRAELAQELSASRIATTAPAEGYYVQSPNEISYLGTEDGDLEKLLRLLSNDTLLSLSSPPPPAPEPSSYAEAPVSSVTQAPVQTAPSTPAPTPTPAPTQAASPPSGGTAGTGGVGL